MNRKHHEDFYRIRVSFNVPVKMPDTTLILDHTNVFVSYMGKYSIYELPYHVTLEDETKLIYDSLKYKYFIFNKAYNFGYLLKNLNDTFSRRINRDSLLSYRAFNAGKGYGKFALPPNHGVKSFEKIFDNGLQKTFRYLVKGSAYDSIYLMFDKSMTTIDFSIYSHEDSAYNSKLSKIILFANPDSISPRHYNSVDYYANSLEISRDTAQNEKELLKLFYRYKEYEKLKK